MKSSGGIGEPIGHDIELVMTSGVEKAVFSFSDPSSSTCQHPEVRSKVVNKAAWAKESSVSSILGR